MAIQDINYFGISNNKNPFTGGQGLTYFTNQYNIPYSETTPEYIMISTGIVFDNISILDRSKTIIRIGVWDPNQGLSGDYVYTSLTPKLGVVGTTQTISDTDIWFFDDERYRGVCFINVKWVSDSTLLHPHILDVSTFIRGTTIEGDLLNYILNVVAGGNVVGDYKYSAQISDHGYWFKCDGRLIDKRLYPELFNLIEYNFGKDDDDENKFGLPDARKYRYLANPEEEGEYLKLLNETHANLQAAISFPHNGHSHNYNFRLGARSTSENNQPSNGQNNNEGRYYGTTEGSTSTPNMNDTSFSSIHKNSTAFIGKTNFNFEWSSETLPSTIIANMFIKVK